MAAPNVTLVDEFYQAQPAAPSKPEPGPQRGGGGGGGDMVAKQKLVFNEQTKLSATALNNVAVGFTVVGIVTPIISFFQQPLMTTGPQGVIYVAASMISLLTAGIIHIGARAALKYLEP